MSRSTPRGVPILGTVAFGIFTDTTHEHDLVVANPLLVPVNYYSIMFTNTMDRAVTLTLYGVAGPGGTYVQIAQAISAIGNGTTQVQLAEGGSTTLLIIAGSAVSSATGNWTIPLQMIGGFKVTALTAIGTPTVGSIAAVGGYH